RLVGFTRRELQGMAVTDLAAADDRELVAGQLAALVRGEVPAYQAERRYRRKDGGSVWVQAHAVAVRDAAGVPVRVAAVLIDLSERKRAEEALAALNATLEARVAERTAAAEAKAAELARSEAALRKSEFLFRLIWD